MWKMVSAFVLGCFNSYIFAAVYGWLTTGISLASHISLETLESFPDPFMGGLFVFATLVAAAAMWGGSVCIVVAVVFSGALLWRAIFRDLLVVVDDHARSTYTRTFILLFMLLAMLAPSMASNPDRLTITQALFAYFILAAGAALTGFTVARNLLITPIELEAKLAGTRPRATAQAAESGHSATGVEGDTDRWKWAHRKWVYVLLAFPLAWYAFLHFAVFRPAGCDMPVVCEQSPYLHVRLLIKSFDTIARISWVAAAAILVVIVVRGIARSRKNQ